MAIATLITWIVVGAIAGLLAKFFIRSHQSVITSIVVGIIGGFVGGLILSLLGIGGEVTGLNIGSILVAFIGAVVLLGILSISRKSSVDVPPVQPNTLSSAPAKPAAAHPAQVEPVRSTREPTRPAKGRTIFMSYRRSDSQDVAGRIYDRLVGAFGPESIFKDVDAIRPGADFRQEIDEFLNQCDVVLVLVGAGWLEARDQEDRRRLDNPADFVRIEIETALSRNIIVIPVLLHNAAMPLADELPATLQPLLFRNAVVVRPDPDFHRDMDRLISALQ
jgi:uncharacterized membrane protein YeaQ/YmgE (transglycosylase-associated protein family)